MKVALEGNLNIEMLGRTRQLSIDGEELFRAIDKALTKAGFLTGDISNGTYGHVRITIERLEDDSN